MLNYSLVLVQKLDQGSLFDYFTVHDLSLDRRELDWFLSAIVKDRLVRKEFLLK